MAKRNISKFAILGLLSWRPMSGYDMKTYIEEGIKFFWNMSYGTIYPTLKRLEEEKLVEKEVQSQINKPDRIQYSITPAGKAKLDEWLLEPTEMIQVNNELLLKLFVGQHVPFDQHIMSIGVNKQKTEAVLKLFRDSEGILKEQSKHSKEYLFFYLTLRYGILAQEAKLKWCDESMEILKGSSL